MISEVGLAVTVAPVVAESPVDEAHVYDMPPDAVSGVELPVQSATSDPPLITGNALTVNVAVDAQPVGRV